MGVVVKYTNVISGRGLVRSVFMLAVCGLLVSCSPNVENEAQAEAPKTGQPSPLVNPNVYQNFLYPFRTERVERIFAPGVGGEILLSMEENASIIYQWSAEGGALYSDFHGHDSQVADYWVQYRLDEAGETDYGSLSAPFAGEHGWYFRNDGDSDVIVSLRVSGYYSAIEK